tara:strand:+ start:128 stop:1231 length:1104 start_codon:yes stop_codon:yes gene_type:complete
MKENFISLGLMSGTSMDGIDASIVKSDGEQFIEIIDDSYLKYENELKFKLKKIINLCTSRDTLLKFSKEIKEVENEVTHKHIEAFKLISKKNKNLDIDLIGFHGQTILHKPESGYSIQIGNSKTLSRFTGKIVVSDFRKNDISNGGQGAPLTPLYHQQILNKIKSNYPSVIINIGGISNITYLDKNNNLSSFDTGPGNYLIDEWVSKKNKMEFDEDGLIARSGKINGLVLNELLSNPYYKKKFPKTLDVKDFYLKDLDKLSLADGCATLSMLTVKTICIGINSFKDKVNTIIISGGGRKNNFIINNIKKILNRSINLIDEYNFNGDFIESQAFGYLAIRSYLKKNITYPNTTGVKKPCTGGLITKIQ